MNEIEIICIGDELLNSSTKDSNSFWLVKKISAIGGKVNRITIIPDDLQTINFVVKNAITREPKWIITTGGLGPTDDDKTLEGVSVATNKPLITNPQGIKILKKKYQQLGHIKKLNKFRIKMAKSLKGSELVENPKGISPGILLKIDGTKIICLPGVQKEMKKIFLKKIRKAMKKDFFEKIIHIKKFECNIKNMNETELIPFIKKCQKEIDTSDINLNIKTHAQTPKKEKSKIRIVIFVSGENKDKVEKKIKMTKSELKKFINVKKGKLHKID